MRIRNCVRLVGCSVAAVLLAVTAAVSSAAPVAHLRAAELTAGARPHGIVDNRAFVPPSDAVDAREPFNGTLLLAEHLMISEPRDLKYHRMLGKDVQYFPAVRLGFVTVDGDLVPLTQEVIRAGSTAAGKSYWDVIVQPGRVWTEKADGGWSRAAFPFALVHTLEGETHNGLATFLYRGGKVSALRYQIVQQTTPGHIELPFTAAGSAPARFEPLQGADTAAVIDRYRASVRDAVPVRPWEELERKVGADRLAGFDAGLPAAETVLTGLDYQGVLYLKPCTSAGGPLPWCDRTRFGVWSVTKAFANEVALLRLAQKYGKGVFSEKIVDYVPEAQAYPAWANVTFDDCINMATGVGNGSTKYQPNDISDGYIDATYNEWADAPSVADKVAALLRIAKTYPWGPGVVARYRDQDMYILGVAMDRYLKHKEGPTADLWTMLEREVYGPIGIHYAPINRSIESDGRVGHPLMAYGYYATVGDLVKVARLYHARGAANGVQILFRPRIDELYAGVGSRGLPAGGFSADGETTYFNAFWNLRFQASGGCRLYIPQMEGWGENLVGLFPGGLTGIRIAHSPSDASGGDRDSLAMVRAVDRVAPFCGQ